MTKIEPKQQRFADEYLVDSNATAAAIRAGYSARSARVTSAKLLKNPRVAAYIAERRNRIATKLEITTERILEEARRLAFVDPANLVHPDGKLKGIHEIDENTRAAIASVEVVEICEGVGKNRRRVGTTTKFKLWDKNPAIERLFKHFDLFPPKRVEAKATVTSRVYGLSDLLDDLDGADTGVGPAKTRRLADKS